LNAQLGWRRPNRVAEAAKCEFDAIIPRVLQRYINIVQTTISPGETAGNSSCFTFLEDKRVLANAELFKSSGDSCPQTVMITSVNNCLQVTKIEGYVVNVSRE
jgi:hypothetical protein